MVCAGGEYGWERGLLHRAAFLYTVNGLAASTDPVGMQGKFDALTWLFDRLRLRKNVGKTVGMTCRHSRAFGNQFEAKY